ncbi:MAG: autotransporter-associated beta strand repeat-containing protein [Verrucomicrobiota bacterium]
MPSFIARPLSPPDVSRWFRIAGIVAASSWLPAVAAAADVTWSGGTSSDWGTGGNWTGGTAPGSGDVAEFNSATANQPSVGTGATVGAVWVTTGVTTDTTIGGAGTLAISGGQTIGTDTGVGILLDDSGNHNLTINGPVATNAATSFVVNNNGTLTVNGQLSLTGQLTLGAAGDSASGTISLTGGTAGNTSAALLIQTNGTVNLSGTYNNTSTGSNVNTVSGGTMNLTGSMLGKGLKVTAGTANINTNGSVGSGVVTVSGGTLTVNPTNGITGAATAVVVSSGTLNLSAANNFGGGTTLSSGTISVGNSNALGTGALGWGGGTLAASAASVDLGNAVSLSSNGTISGGNALTFGGAVSISGAANRTITVNNTGGATFGAINLSSSNSTTGRSIIFNGASNATLGGVIADGAFTGGGLTYSGTGTLFINDGSNSYTGVTAVGTAGGSTATVSVGAAGALGGSAVAFNGGTLVAGTSLSGANSLANSVGFSASGTTGTISGSNDITFTGSLTGVAGTLTVNNSGLTTFGGNTYLSSSTSTGQTFSIAGSGNTTLSGVVANTSATGATVNNNLAYNGTGTLILSNAANTYSGSTTVSNNGTISVSTLGTGGNASGIGASSNVASNLVLNNGTLQYTGGSATTDHLFTVSGATGTLDASGTGAINFSNTGAIAFGTTAQTRTLILTGNNTGSNTLAAAIGNNGTTSSGVVSVTKNGAGTWILTGTSTYTGATTVNAGLLDVNGSLASGGAVTIVGGALGGTGTVGAVTVDGGAGINLQGNGIGALKAGSLTLGTGTTALSFDITSGATNNLDSIANAGALVTDGASTITVGFLNGSAVALSAGTYTLISGPITQQEYNTFSLTDGTLGNYSLALVDGGSAGLELQVTLNSTPVNSYFYTGKNGTDFTNVANYNTDATSGVVQTTPLGSSSDVTLGTTSPVPSNLAPVLDSNLGINSLTFAGSGAGATLSGTGTLALGASAGAGLTDNAGGGTTETVAVPVALGKDQTWTVANAGNTLNVSGGISGGHALTVAGSGRLEFSADSLYSGARRWATARTRRPCGSTNGHASAGSAVGTGALNVLAGATIGGDGAARVSSFAIAGKVIVGNGTDAVSQTTITGTNASTLAGANLTFNLDTTNANSNVLNVGSTSLAFDGTTLTFNLLGTSIVSTGRQYVLIDGTSDGQYTTLHTFMNGQNQLEIDTATSGLNFAFGNVPSSFYAGSYLFLSNGDIEVEVVPEPSTWALMLGGLAALVLWQRRRSRQGVSGESQDLRFRHPERSRGVRSVGSIR